MNLGADNPRIFRITHLDNVPWILDNGLRCQNSSVNDPNFVPIGMADLIGKRKHREVEIDPFGTLADYVPFHFTPWSIMMYNIKTGYNGVTKRRNEEIVVLVSSLAKLREAGVRFLFTNGHAYPLETEYFSDMESLDQIDWPLLQSRNFRKDPEDPGKQGRYQAEALAYQHVPITALIGIACYDEASRSTINRAVTRRGLSIQAKTLPKFYF